MDEIKITDRQREFLTTPLHRINILEGSVRSGKTWISLVMWALLVASMPKSAEFLMTGKTLTTLHRNCLILLQQLEPTFKYSLTGKRGTLYGHTIWLEGAENQMSENKIRGMTLAGAYCDEITLMPRNFYYMLLSRLSYNGAKLIATTNPDSPNHYVYTEIIQNETIDKSVFKFLITQNTFLDPDYVKSLENEYSGVFYQRYFLGEWVIAEGLVYPMYDNTAYDLPDEPFLEYSVSMDYGILNATAMLLWGYAEREKRWYCIDEYYHSGRETYDQHTDEQYYEALEQLVGDRAIVDVIIDPSAASFITLIRQKHRFKVRQADNEVITGIQHTASALQNKKIMFMANCKRTIAEFGLYSWDEDSGEDKVLKVNDHAMDATRYFVQTKRLFRQKNDYISVFGGG